MKPPQELTVISKTYDLILWSCHHTSRFHRNHRFVLGERIERNLYDLLEILLEAKFRRGSFKTHFCNKYTGRQFAYLCE